MAKIGTVQNGLPKSKPNGTKKKSNPLTLARVKGFLKSNGLKSVPRGASLATVANPKHKKEKGKKTHKKKSNGLINLRSARNGLFGNTKSDVKNVSALLAGLVGGKTLARFLQSFVAPYLASMNLGKYAEILSDGAVALFIAPMVARKIAGNNAADMARLGGLANVAVDVIEMLAPDALSGFLSGNVLTGGQPVLTPAQVANIVNNTSASPQEKAQIAGVMQQIESGGGLNFAPQVMPNLAFS